MNKHKNGFTLIELIVIIAVVSLLASIVAASLRSANLQAKITHRVADLNQVRAALEVYFNTNGSYPSPNGVFRSECSAWGGFDANNVIPGLVPTYMSGFPSDPSMDKINNSSCYIYASNGVDYVFLDFAVTDPGFDYSSQPALTDPSRDGGADACAIDGRTPFSWKVYSPGGSCW